MKKFVITLLALIMFPLSARLIAQENQDFTSKALEYAARLKNRQLEYLRVESRYKQMLGRLNEIKAKKNGNPISSFIDSMKMNYYLQAGNRAGYKIYVLKNQIKELSSECFTFDTHVADDLSKKLIDGLAAGGGDGQKIYDERERWTMMAMESGGEMNFDLDVAGLLDGLSPQAKDDLKKYLEKKQVQLDERIYMLNEEKEINEAAKKAGLIISGAAGKSNDSGMEKFMKMKKEAGEILKKLE